MSDNKRHQAVEIKPGNPGKRPEITDKTTHVEYFEELMFDRVNMCHLPKIESLDIAIEFDIVGQSAGSWTVVVEKGLLKRILRNHLESHCIEGATTENNSSLQDTPDSLSKDPVLKSMCTFRLDGHTFMSIVRCEITPQQAFFDKKVEIEGDVALALKMNILVNYL